MKRISWLFGIIPLLFVFSACGSNGSGMNTEIRQEGNTLTMEEIWRIEDTTDFVIALSQHIDEKCQYGDNMSALSEAERVFYITQTLEMEVNNGGFSQYFYNSSGDFANELVHAFTEIGAAKTAEICKKAVSIYDGEVPADRAAREEVFADNEELEAILEECDNGFYAYEEDLDTLNYEYVMRNREAFT